MSQYIQTPPPPQNMPSAPAPRPNRHALALPTLILGIIGLLIFPLAFIALLLGVICLLGIKKSNGMKTGNGLAILGCLLAVVSLVFVFVIANSLPDVDPLPTGKAITPEATLAIAETNIISDSQGVAYSNSAEGLAMAKRFSELFKDFAEVATDSLSERHEFVTHCQLHDDSVAFLVHVPKLRNFDDESKERFCETAWVLAGMVIAENAVVDEGTDLAVGVKGNILYQNIYFGKYVLSEGDEPEGVNSRSKEKVKLERFFKGAPEESNDDDGSLLNEDAEELEAA